jgi:sugar O-acyltransferase (sialic acid O-acetyltransferase NeuD family)
MKLGIFGSSGFAREVADVASAIGHQPILIRDDSDESPAPSGYRSIREAEIRADALDGFSIGVGDNAVRKRIAERYPDLNWVNLVHPTASFGSNMQKAFKSAKGLIICAGARLTNSIRLGDFVILNLNITIGHDCALGDFVNLSPGAHVSGNVTIGDQSWLGTNSSVNNGTPDLKLMISPNCTIGSGAVVIRDLEEAGTYVGAPARQVKK